MKIGPEMAKLICELEYLLGGECYNPSSYDGWTGSEGLEYRYPVYALKDPESNELSKFRGNVAESANRFSERTVRTMKYKFGANHLFVGNGIKKVLEAIEERYDLDFNELEAKHIQKYQGRGEQG